MFLGADPAEELLTVDVTNHWVFLNMTPASKNRTPRVTAKKILQRQRSDGWSTLNSIGSQNAVRVCCSGGFGRRP